MTAQYAELQATSNFSFLRGGSHPGELVMTAKALDLAAIGVADRNTLAGVVRAWSKGREIGQRVLTGSRLDFADGSPSVLCYPKDREAYGRLSRLLSLGQRRSIKGQCHLTWADLAAHGEGQLIIAIPPPAPGEAFERQLAALAGDFRGRVWLAASRGYGALDLQNACRGWPASPPPRGRPWWRPMTCSTTPPPAGRCRMCSAACARAARSRPPA